MRCWCYCVALLRFALLYVGVHVGTILRVKNKKHMVAGFKKCTFGCQQTNLVTVHPCLTPTALEPSVQFIYTVHIYQWRTPGLANSPRITVLICNIMIGVSRKGCVTA